MSEHLTMIGIAFVIWPVTKSLIIMVAAAVTFWSRDERRQQAAGRILTGFSDPEPLPDL